MADISEQEIDLISRDIDERGLTYVRLKNELLDHICCQIEEAMEQGMTFNEAYRKVREEMGKKRIRQIQHETLSLINKKYRRMKRTMYGLGVAAPIMVAVAAIFKAMHWPGGSLLITLGLFLIGMIFLPIFVMIRIRDTRSLDEPSSMGMYITGLLSGMVTILGALFKIQHWAGAGVLLTLGLVTLTFVFLPIYFIVRVREAKRKDEPIDKNLLIGGIISAALFLMGALFKIQHWPGAGYVILASWSAVAVLFLPFLMLHQLKKPENRINNFMGIVVVSTAVAMFLTALLRSQPKIEVTGYFVPEHAMNSSASYINDRAGSVILNLESQAGPEINSSVQEISEKADEVCAYIHSIKKDMVNALTKDDTEVIDKQGNIGLKSIKVYTNWDVARGIIVERDKYKLFSMVNEFRDFALKQTNNDQLEQYINDQLSFVPENKDDERKIEDIWAWNYFRGPLIQSAANLSMYESSVRLIEYELLNELKAKVAETAHQQLKNQSF